MGGWLSKKSRQGGKSFRGWHLRYFVLNTTTKELSYYRKMLPSSYGNIPLEERSCIDLRLLKSVYIVPKPGKQEARFDIQLFCDPSCGRYVSSPRNDIRKTLGPVKAPGYRVISLSASSAEERARWIEA